MKNYIRITSLLVMLVFSQYAFSQISADYDKSVDFSKYKTYTFAPWQKGSDQVVNQIDQGTIMTAFKSELGSRGLSMVDSSAGPDLIITFYVVIKNETSTTAYTQYNGGLGLGYGAAWGYGMGSATTTYSEDDYQEGTFVVDFYDAKTKKLLWQGTIQGVVKKASKRGKTIPKKVSQLMNKYPVDPVK